MKNNYLLFVSLLSCSSVIMLYLGSRPETTAVYGKIRNLRDRFPSCCKALTKECMACAAGMLVHQFCEQHPGQYRCPETTPVPVTKVTTVAPVAQRVSKLPKIMIGIPVHDRQGYVSFSSKVLARYNHVDPNDIFVFDDASTEYDEKKLREWYGKDIKYFRSSKRLGADANTRRLFTYFSESDYDIRFAQAVC